MRVIARKSLIGFGKKFPDAKSQLDVWYKIVTKEVWNNFSDIRKLYNSADLVKGHHVIFNIKGNQFRLEVKIAFKIKTVFIIWFGTHKEYDKRNKERK